MQVFGRSPRSFKSLTVLKHDSIWTKPLILKDLHSKLYSDVTRRWREQWGYIGRGGVVVLFDGEVQSWVNELRNPEHWQPGCIAVDEDGKSWTTMAGNEQNGALI